MDDPRGGTIRLQSYLSKAGVASRRACAEIIRDGKVRVNGRIVSDSGARICRGDVVVYAGRTVKPVSEFLYYALNKPVGYLCSSRDPFGRRIAVDLITDPEALSARIYNVGRLDYHSSGLVFFTNDGDFARKVSHPSTGLEKEYIVTSTAEIPKEDLESFLTGRTVGGLEYRLSSYELIGPARVRLVLTEGKNREIRHMFEAIELPIESLHRVRIGSVGIGDLAPGEFRELSTGEIEALTWE